MADVALVMGVVLLIPGIVKRRLSVGRIAIVAGAVLIAVSVYFTWPDFLRGFRDAPDAAESRNP